MATAPATRSSEPFDDEFNSKVTFVSPGLIAMANAGSDTQDSQFFITDPDISFAQQPQNLNFHYTIFGQLVSGFATFDKIMGTPVGAQSASNPELSKPLTNVVINTATIIDDGHDGVLRISAPDSFRGTDTITVTATGGTGGSARHGPAELDDQRHRRRGQRSADPGHPAGDPAGGSRLVRDLRRAGHRPGERPGSPTWSATRTTSAPRQPT